VIVEDGGITEVGDATEDVVFLVSMGTSKVFLG
jgi:hypothetical protein